ncbi:MAG: hypothetical protein MMC23_006554 [Stictis urceolatum]|nr:hypothetical protein [Stictis urceolata]
MRNVLLERVADHVHWGKILTHVSSSAEGVTAHFSEGTSAVGSFLIGADGVRSAVRKSAFPDLHPLDFGGGAVYVKTTLTREIEERVSEKVLCGMVLAQECRRGTPLTLFAQPVRFQDREEGLPVDYIYWVLSAQKSLFGMEDAELLGLDADGASDVALELTKDWNGAVKALFELQDRDQTGCLRIASDDPKELGAKWTKAGRGRVTLMGDAAHVMSPTGSIGANSALKDAEVLVGLLRELGPCPEALTRYEDEMGKYAKETVEMSYGGAQKFFAVRPWEELDRLDL